MVRENDPTDSFGFLFSGLVCLKENQEPQWLVLIDGDDFL